MSQPIYLVSAARTPIGAFLGSLSSLPAPRLGAVAIQGALKRAGVAPEWIEEVFMGNVLSAGIGQAPARQAAIYAGVPHSVPATTVSKVCGSGMQALIFAAKTLALGDAELVVAGGMESMSNAPYYLTRARSGYRMGNANMIDGMIHDGLWDPYGDTHMGNCGDLCAREQGFSREQQDEFAARSFKLAQKAQADGKFTAEIEPVAVPQRKGDPVQVASDEGLSKGGDLAKMAALRPAFAKDGTVTAANASSLNDGASALVLASESAVKKHGLKPMAKLLGYSGFAQEPERFTTAPAKAMSKLLQKLALGPGDIDLYEINEAFSVVALASAKLAELPLDRVNVRGGAVSIGHPIGASGARIVTTLLHALKDEGKKRGMASICIGGGEALALAVEAL